MIYISFKKAVAMFVRAGLANEAKGLIWSFAQAYRNAEARGAKHGSRGGLRLRTRPAAGPPKKGGPRTEYHEGDIKIIVCRVLDAVRENRRTDQPYRFRAENWVPAVVAEREYGFEKTQLIMWSKAYTPYDCHWIGRRIKARRWLARGPSGRFRPVLFFREKDLAEAKAAKDRNQPARPRGKDEPEKPPRPPVPDPAVWVENEEAIRITGVGLVVRLYKYHRKGFLTLTGKRIPLRKKVVHPEGYLRRATFWRRSDLEAIAKWRATQPEPGDAGGALVEKDEKVWRRERSTKQLLGCSHNGLVKWATTGCEGLGGDKLLRDKVPSQYPGMPYEWAYWEDQVQALAGIPIAERPWGKGRQRYDWSRVTIKVPKAKRPTNIIVKGHANILPAAITLPHTPADQAPGAASPQGGRHNMAAIRVLTGLGNNTINSYAASAGLLRAKRGERNFAYTTAQAIALLDCIARESSEDATRSKCAAAAENLRRNLGKIA